MKLMKKVLVLALAASTILMVACNNGNGGEPSGNGGGNGEFVPPALPENKGDDPFAGLKTLTTDSPMVRYLVDTEKKVLTEEESTNGTTWSKSAEYVYSYDGTANPPTVTGRLEAQYDKAGKRLTPAEQLAAGEAEFKAGFTEGFGEMFDQLKDLDAATKEAMLAELNEAYGLSLTVADLDASKKAATLEKVWNSKMVQDMLKEQRETLKKMLSMTPTYAVTLTEKSETTAKIAVEGQYDSKLPWYDQTAGGFMGYLEGVNVTFMPGYGYISSGSGDYQVTAVTENSITCSDYDGNSKTFSYAKTGSDKDTVVTVDVDDTSVDCTWQPSTQIGQ